MVPIENKANAQEILTNIIGINAELFKQSIFFAQKSLRLVDKTDAQKDVYKRQLQYCICAIHEQDSRHEHDFSKQDEISVKPGPCSHLCFPETRESENISTGQENNSGHKGKCRKNFYQANYHRIEPVSYTHLDVYKRQDQSP